MLDNGFLLVFAAAFVGCILATPVVTRLAGWAGAIDRPDAFRRIHKGAIPRLGGLAVAFGLALALALASQGAAGPAGRALEAGNIEPLATIIASLIVLALGVVDDTRGVNPRSKLLGQTAAVLVLVAGGIRITKFSLLGVPFDVSSPIPLELGGWPIIVDPLSTLVTLLWFLACMNIWNLIDGMDGLASGVGLLVSGTLMLVALREGNAANSAALAAALAGSLAGFLVYNWHPACIFLGDSGSLLIGLLIGVIGVQSSMKGTTTVSILFPILAMGLPITDTAMAIFRRWVRDLPLSSADRRHVHHLLIGLGLDPRQAAVMLYCLTGFLCGVVLLGVTLNNSVHGEFFALLVGLSGCGAFLLILTSRRDELAGLLSDLKARNDRRRREREAARLTWESIQKIELCEREEAIWDVLREAGRKLGCADLVLERDGTAESLVRHGYEPRPGMSDSGASFRLTCGEPVRLSLAVTQAADDVPTGDIAFRALQRLTLATAQRLERLVAWPEPLDLAPMPRPLVVEAEGNEGHPAVSSWFRAAHRVNPIPRTAQVGPGGTE